MRLRRTLPALPLSTAAHAAVPLPAYLRCAISSNCDSAACPLAAHEAPLHPYRLHATCYCYSAACYYRPAKFRCTPYSAACDAAIPPPAIPGRRSFRCTPYSAARDAAIPRPAIPGLRSSAARLIRLHAMLLFRRLLFQACEVPLHVLFGCMRCCYSAACYSRPARFRCTPYSAACDAAIPPPAIPGWRSSAACLIRLHATLLFRRLLFQAGEVSAARLIRLHAMLPFRGLLFQACEVPLHALFGCTRCCCSAACYYRPTISAACLFMHATPSANPAKHAATLSPAHVWTGGRVQRRHHS